MNTAGITTLGSKAKPAAEAIARTCERYGFGCQFGHAGKHPYAEITWNRQSRKVYFSGTPTDRRATHNVITDVKKAARSLGWEPTNDNQETKMQIVKTMADLPRLAERSFAPEIPAAWRGKSIRGRATSSDLQAALKKRNAWIMEQSAAGVRHADILEDLRRAGWDIQSAGAIDMVVFKGKGGTYPSQTKPALPKPANPSKTDPGPIRVEMQHQSPEGMDALVFAIAQAIAPLIRDQLAQQSKAIEALKAKADKWDAISGLVREA